MKKIPEKTSLISAAGSTPPPRSPAPNSVDASSRTQYARRFGVSSSKSQSLCERIRDFDLSAVVTRRLQQADLPFWFTFAAVFLTLNLIFLFHGVHFMFGDHDWKYLKHGISLGAGLFEGRFSQFLPVTILSRGEILPVINNALGFAGFSLGIALLSRYWRLPHTKNACIMFGLFAALTPYILSFMYFAFLVIPVLSWNLFIIAALFISEKEEVFSFRRTIAAAVLTTLALGGYPPVINLIAVAFSLRLLFAALFEIPSSAATVYGMPSVSFTAILNTLCRRFRWTVFNILLGIICYKLCLLALTKTGAVNVSYYNLQTTPLGEWGSKFLLVSRDVWLQFLATLPFIPAAYKIAAGITVLAGTMVALLRIFTPLRSRTAADTPAEQASGGFSESSAARAVTPNVQNTAYSFSTGGKIIVILLLAAVFYTPLVTLFISASLAETEFSPRIDFFGLMYLYAGLFALVLKNAAFAAKTDYPAPAGVRMPCSVSLAQQTPRPALFIKNIAIIGAVFSIIISVHCLFEAQKVWKLGFDAEMKLYRRASARFMASPDFTPGSRYIMIQGGSPAFRPRFYQTPYHYGSDDLLGISYVPGMNSAVMWNYYGVTEYADPAAYVYTFRPDAASVAAINSARPWPAPQSSLVLPAHSPDRQNLIILILSPEGLTGLKKHYHL